MATTRVYILAKKLGVKSSAIVEKCQAEGLAVKNHMSVISAGLAATIQEWFSEGENVTTIETAEKVDLEKVRVKRKPAKTKKTAKAAQPQGTEQPQPAEEGHPATQLPPAPEEPSTLQQTPGLQATAVAIEQVQPQEKTPAGLEAREQEQQQTEARPPRAKPGAAVAKVKKKKPEVKPAGPILKKPAPARLTGPEVVRFEEPEPVVPVRPRRRHDEPVTEPLLYDEDQEKLGPAAGKGSVKTRKERTHGRRQEDDEWRLRKKAKLSKWRERDIEERKARLDAAAGEGLRLRPVRRIATKSRGELAAPAKPKKVTVNEPITVKELSAALAVKTSDIITKLMQQGVMAGINQTLSNDAAELVALEFGTELEVIQKQRLEDRIREEFDQRERKNLTRRAVVATMLGHVDHGKTSLLDKIRSTQVTATEAGGITQHIGAYQVNWNRAKVTFLDTPGHEAFTAMRARGANMTDIVVLVVAADDGVMPQTVEAIAHSKAANVPVIVALNKIDLPGADINRIYAQLAEQDLTPVEWGGKTDLVKTSAVTGEGIEDLLEHLDYTAELLNLEADPTIPATGWVVEAKMSPTRGPVATLLVKEGRLRKGDVLLAGVAYGRVKLLKDSFGKVVNSATSSMPVEITGLSDVPQAGDRFYVLDDINRAKAAAEENRVWSREKSLSQRSRVTLDNLFSQIEAGKVKELNLIIRADVQGSVDVLNRYLSELSTDEVKVKILHSAPGAITEGDVVLAEASDAIIIGFNVVADDRVAAVAEARGVEIRLYNVIYRITEDLRKSMAGLLEPEEKEETLGRAVVRKIFKVSRIGTIAGCYVTSGLVTNSARVRLIRDNVVIRDGLSIASLKHLKDDIREAKAGLECGIKLAKFDDLKDDDVLEFYQIIEVERTL